jgi:hypothetical protein
MVARRAAFHPGQATAQGCLGSPAAAKGWGGKGVNTKEQKLRAAMKAAREFINRSELLLAYWEAGGSTLTGTAPSGAVRRASMELTRSLSEYRKP